MNYNFTFFPEMGKCSGHHPLSESQFHQIVDIVPLCSMLCVMQLLRKSYSELKLLEAVSSPQNEDSVQTDNSREGSGQVAAERQHELVEKVLKNVAVASEVLQTLLIVSDVALRMGTQICG